MEHGLRVLPKYGSGQKFADRHLWWSTWSLAAQFLTLRLRSRSNCPPRDSGQRLSHRHPCQFNLMLAQPMNITECKLFWRWKDLPPNVLDSLLLIDTLESKKINESIVRHYANGILDCTAWFSAKEFKLEDDVDKVANWLRNLPVPVGSIVLSWDIEISIKTNWDTFVSHWDDFLYPGSDDVAVFGNDGLWLLDFNHEGKMTYVTRCLG